MKKKKKEKPNQKCSIHHLMQNANKTEANDETERQTKKSFA